MIVARLAAAALRWPRLFASLLVAVTLALGSGTRRLTTEVGYQAFLGHHHPVVTQLDGFLSRFGGGLPIAAVWSCEESPCDDALDASSLAMAYDVATTLGGAPGVVRVDGPATSPVLVGEFLGLPRARRLAPEGKPAADLERLASAARADPLWRRQIVSEDGRAGAILVHLESTDGATSRAALTAVRRAVAPWEARGFRFHFVGGPVEFVVAGDELESNTAEIVPFMVALVGLVLYAVFRSVAAVAISLATVGVAVLWTFGTMGWLGWPQNSFTQALAPLLLVVGVCDAIHFVARILARSDASSDEAILAASREVAAPCLMTSVTTAAGFASLATSPLESIARFGVLATVGVAAALVSTFTLLPLLMHRLPGAWIRAPALAGRWDRALDGLARFARERRRWILGVSMMATALSLLGLLALRVDATFEDLYGRDSQVVRWSETVSRVLRRPDTLEIALEPPRGADPAKTLLPGLKAIERVEEALQGLDGIGRPRSLLDPMRRLNRLAHHQDLDLSMEEADLHVASLRRLLRNADRDVISLLRNPDTGDLRISAEAAKLPQDRLRDVLERVRVGVDGALPPGWTATITGPLAVVQIMIDEIRTTQLRSFALAFVIIFAAVAIFLRSVHDGLVAMVPTVLPIAVTLGAMGAVGIPLDVGSAMVAAVVLGIAVDDAIHLLAAFGRARATGATPESATRRALQETGQAVVGTSVALALGFLLLTLSPWKSIASFGLVAAVAISVALAAALVVLPALLGGPSATPARPGARW